MARASRACRRRPARTAANFSPGLVHYLDTWSDLHTPPTVKVHKADGTAVRTVHESRIPALAGAADGQARVPAGEDARRLRDGGDPVQAGAAASAARKVPVMQFTYGGPYAPRVANRWGGTGNMYYQMLADRGIAVWICDNRSASGKGAQSAWTSYKQLGVQELADIEDGLGLAAQAAVGERAFRTRRLELRRLHDHLRAHPFQELHHGHRRRQRHRLAALRQHLYRAH